MVRFSSTKLSDGGNRTIAVEKRACVFSVCTEPTTVYELYGAAMTIAFLFTATALGLSVIFYGYLLVHPVAKTRAYVRNNVKLFPFVVVLMVAGMILVGWAVCVEALTMFGDFAGALVGLIGTCCLSFFFAVLVYMEYKSYREVDDYRLVRANKWMKMLD